MENIRNIQGFSAVPRFGAVPAPVLKPLSFGQDGDRYEKPGDGNDGSGNKFAQWAKGLKNGFVNMADYFRPDNKRQIMFDLIVGSGIGLISAIGTPVFLVTGPACIGLMMSISLIMRFAEGLLAKPEEFEAIREMRRSRARK